VSAIDMFGTPRGAVNALWRNGKRHSTLVGHLKYHERTIGPVTDRLAAIAHLANCRPTGDYVCYEGPEDWAFAAGIAANVIADRRRLLVRSAAGEWAVPWHQDVLRQLPAMLDRVPVDSWRLYGWAGFDLAAANAGLLDIVGDDSFLNLMIPATEVRFDVSGTLLRAIDPADLDRLEAELASTPPLDYRAQPVLESSGADRYLDAVGRAVADIESGRLEKVILSRSLSIDYPVDIVGTYALGRRANSPARSYLLSLGGIAAAGFSPETVVEVTSDGVVTTQPLAGTRARTGRAAVDEELRRELLADPKEVYEHAISVKLAFDEMVDLCGDQPVEIPEFMAIRQRGTVQHIASSVRSTLTGRDRAWDAFCALFPAVTTSGVPKEAAYPVIRELEPEGRGIYGGAVLSYDCDGAMDAAVVLRTVFERDGQAWLRAGAGIVRQSRPERELTETREKLASVGRYVVPR